MTFFLIVVAWYALAGAVTFVVYTVDKSRARKRQWRIKESSLHSLALSGGVIGAWVALYALRHKSSKPKFKLILALVTIAHVALWGVVVYAR